MTNDEQTTGYPPRPKDDWTYELVDYFKVISPEEIQEMDEPPFNEGQWSSEEEYKEFMERMQPLFDEYDCNGKIHTVEFKTIEDITRYRDEWRRLNNFNAQFLQSGQYINVVKNPDGTYKVASNGRHRLYVAKKYGLRVLVHVAEERTIKKEFEIPTDSNIAIGKRKGR